MSPNGEKCATFYHKIIFLSFILIINEYFDFLCLMGLTVCVTISISNFELPRPEGGGPNVPKWGKMCYFLPQNYLSLIHFNNQRVFRFSLLNGAYCMRCHFHFKF